MATLFLSLRKHSRTSALPISFAATLIGLIWAAGTETGSNRSQPDTTHSARVNPVLRKLPLYFQANRGQASPQVRFLASGPASLLHLDSRAGFTLRRRGGPPLRLELSGANPAPQAAGQNALPGKSHYFIGNDPSKWVTNVPHYAQVRYREVYPHTDLLYYGKADRLEYDFAVGPGSNPRVIRLRFSGHRRLTIDPGGNLLIDLGREQIRQPKPRVYQNLGGNPVEVAGSYVLHGANEVGFETGRYDSSRPLVIDPVLEYSTYLGGADRDEGRAIAVDGLGFAYVTGTTASTDFPSLGAVAGGSNWHAFVTKLTPSGNAVVYSAFVGGAANDVGTGIAVDSAGNVYASGYTESNDFPVTTNAFQRKRGGLADAYVLKLDPSGARLLYSTFLGSESHDHATGLAVDGAGAAYVTGCTQGGDTISGRRNTTFPLLNPIQAAPAAKSGYEAFVSKLSPDGTRLVYSTFLGGSGSDTAQGIAVDSAGSAYVVGTTSSTDFPSVNAYQRASGGINDAFVTKINAAGTAFVYSTYLGGERSEEGLAVAVDRSGSAYVTGSTESSHFATPGLIGPGDSFPWGDAFVVKLSPAGSARSYMSRIGGRGRDRGLAITVDALGAAYVTGSSGSPDFPVLSPLQPGYGGGLADYSPGDVFVLKLGSDGVALEFSTLMGGFGEENQTTYPFSISDRVGGIALDPLGAIYVTGTTTSPDFPTTSGSLQARFSGFPKSESNPGEAFVLKIDVVRPSLPPTEPTGYRITTVGGEMAGGPYGLTPGYFGAGNPALTTYFGSILSVAVDAADALCLVHVLGDNGPIYVSRIAPDGIVERLIRRRKDPTRIGPDDLYQFSRDTSGGDDQPFGSASSIAFDKSGNLYIAQSGGLGGGVVQRLAMDGRVTTVAGTGKSGFGGDLGPATAAEFSKIDDIATDDAGNLFIADSANHRLRKVNPAGIVNTVAGNGTSANTLASTATGDGGPAIFAPLDGPYSVAVAPDGTLYIGGWYRIRKVAPNGVISTVAGLPSAVVNFNGDGRPAITAQIHDAADLLLDRDGSLLIADFYNCRVRKIGRDGIITTIAGSLGGGLGGDGGPAALALIGGPRSIAMDSEGNLFAATSYDSRAMSPGTGVTGHIGDLIRRLAPSRPKPTVATEGLVHAATYTPGEGLARGSRFTIFGSYLGPGKSLEATRYPLPASLGDVSILLTQAGVTRNAWLTFVSDRQINAILPSDMLPGDSLLTVNYSGFRSAPVAVKILENRFGFFFVRAESQDAGIFQNFAPPSDYRLNSSTSPARPGQIVIAWGTGLGPINAPDYLAPDGGDLSVPVEVLVGDRAARVLYRGRAPGFAGVDNLYFEIPADAPCGCAVPVRANAGGLMSNTVVLAISETGEPCK